MWRRFAISRGLELEHRSRKWVHFRADSMLSLLAGASFGRKTGSTFPHDGPSEALCPGAAAEHGDRTAVLRPAGDVVADRDRALLAVGHGAEAVARDAAGDQVIPDDLGASGGERVVVLAGAALVRMAF